MASIASIPALPEDQRPRERLLAHGPAALTDAEHVALLLGSGRAGVNALDLATDLIQRHGGLAGLRQVDVMTLSREPGIGVAKASRLVAALTLAARSAGAIDTRRTIASSSDIAALTASRFGGARRERVVLLVCGSGNRVLDIITLADGAAHSAAFPVREVLAEVLRRDGAGFAVAHNHPSGDPRPSGADVQTTTALQRAAGAVGLRLLDHVVIAGDEWRSVLANT